MAHIERGAAIILADVEWIRRETARAGSVAFGKVKRVIAEQGKLLPHSNAAVHDELFLVKDAFGLILENILVDAVGTHAG